MESGPLFPNKAQRTAFISASKALIPWIYPSGSLGYIVHSRSVTSYREPPALCTNALIALTCVTYPYNTIISFLRAAILTLVENLIALILITPSSFVLYMKYFQMYTCISKFTDFMILNKQIYKSVLEFNTTQRSTTTGTLFYYLRQVWSMTNIRL